MIYTFKNTQLIKCDLMTVWKFFSNPKNINGLTPKKMHFRTITKNLPDQIHEKMVIVYHVSPLFSIPLKWVTTIISVVPNQSFIDIQQRGPFKKWHHLHTFTETKDGVLMTDLVTYELPFGIIGDLTHNILVKKEIEKLFQYRTHIIHTYFKNE